MRVCTDSGNAAAVGEYCCRLHDIFIYPVDGGDDDIDGIYEQSNHGTCER